jgi:hypothetical protein
MTCLLASLDNKWKKAIRIMLQTSIDYIEYNIKKFEESCCGELPTTKAPSLFAVEGIFKGLEKINEYITLKRDAAAFDIQSESVYW